MRAANHIKQTLRLTASSSPPRWQVARCASLPYRGEVQLSGTATGTGAGTETGTGTGNGVGVREGVREEENNTTRTSDD
jgi:hypothetical protein